MVNELRNRKSNADVSLAEQPFALIALLRVCGRASSTPEVPKRYGSIGPEGKKWHDQIRVLTFTSTFGVAIASVP
jgi:hypothetical protein